MKAVMDAAKSSAAIKQIETKRDTGTTRERNFARYMLTNEEVWARAYSQFIAERSGDPLLLEQLNTALNTGTGRQWTTDDFKPIGAAIETLFKKLKWL